jgi:hypothetical protein
MNGEIFSGWYLALADRHLRSLKSLRDAMKLNSLSSCAVNVLARHGIHTRERVEQRVRLPVHNLTISPTAARTHGRLSGRIVPNFGGIVRARSCALR